MKCVLLDFWGTVARFGDEAAFLGEVDRLGVELCGVAGLSNRYDEVRRCTNILRRASMVEINIDAEAALIEHYTGCRADVVRRIITKSFIDNSVPTPCSLEAIRDLLSAGLRVAIVSNVTNREFITGFMKRYGYPRIPVISSDRELRRKPHPYIFRRALRRLACSPGEAVMVGDEDNDMGAGELGLITVAVGGKARGQANINDLCGLMPALKSLMNGEP